MNALQLSRQQIALNFVLSGVGIGILGIPSFLSYSGIHPLLRLLSLFFLPVGLYVTGLGVAGIIEGGIRMARSLKE